MRKNKLASFTALVLLVTIIALVLVSGTYAKYTTEVSGSDTATVAKFSVTATDGTNSIDSDSFALFNTIKDTDGSVESDVKSGTIAPGTQGSFDIVLTNNSEVSVSYSLAVTETQSGDTIPIEYSTDNGSTWAAAGNFTKTGNILLTDTEQTTTVTVQWRWAYENGISTDEADTSLGTATTAPSVEVKVTATFTQVD